VSKTKHQNTTEQHVDVATMTPEARGFVDSLLKLAAAQPVREPKPLEGEAMQFVRELLALHRDHPKPEAATRSREAEAFVMEHWSGIVQRVESAVAAEYERLNEQQRELLAVLEGPKSLLVPLGKARDEVSHSKLMSWALGLESALGQALRKSFLTLVNADAGVPLPGWRVRNEVEIAPKCRMLERNKVGTPTKGRIDVHITVPQIWRCYVEMKVDAPERRNQLYDYSKALMAATTDEQFGSTLVFLTIEGRRSNDDVPHQTLSFSDLLAAWLPLSVGTSEEHAYLRLWLGVVAHELCGASGDGPMSTWSLSQRTRALRLLSGLGDKS